MNPLRNKKLKTETIYGHPPARGLVGLLEPYEIPPKKREISIEGKNNGNIMVRSACYFPYDIAMERKYS